jgi:hypothetical protein
MPEVVVGHPCVLKVDSRLRGNDDFYGKERFMGGH